VRHRKLTEAWYKIVDRHPVAYPRSDDVPRVATARSRKDAEYDADLVVKRGVATKNRFGTSMAPIDLHDGCYIMVRIEPPKRRARKP
jgi:hypothetical protein